MSILHWIMGIEPRDKTEERSVSTLSNPSSELSIALGAYTPSPSGVQVNENTALRMISVYAAVRVLAEGVGSLPLHLYAKQKNGSRVRVTDDPRARLLDNEPNTEMSAYDLWEGVVGSLNLWGNAYLYREVSPSTGLTTALWPLRSDSTYPNRRQEDNALYFITQLYNGEQKVLLPDEIIHFKAFGSGDLGLSPIGLARNAIGTALAVEDYSGRFYANNSRPDGLIEFQSNLTDDQIKDVMTQWRASHQGLSRSHLTGILTNGASWKDIGVNPVDQQLIEQKHFGVREIARLFRVPPFLIADLEGSSQYKSIEEQSINFLTYSLRPWLVRIEQQLMRSMFSSGLDRNRGLYPEFLAEGLLRGDTKSRYESYGIALTNGWMSKAEVRELENLPYEKGLGFEDVKPPAPAPNFLPVDPTAPIVPSKP